MLKVQRTLKLHEGAIHVVRYNVSGQYCLSGGQDREIHLLNPNTGNKIKTYAAHGTLSFVFSYILINFLGWEVLDISVSTDNARFSSVGGDKAV